MEFTGERYVPTLKGDIALEHLHRYLLARNLCRDKAVLDLASGEGYGSAILAEAANKVVGVDISSEAVQHAQRKYVRPNLRFLVGDCVKIPLEDHSVDIVASFETLEHIGQHDEMMAELKRVLRPSGILVISTPDKYRYSDVPSYKNPFHVKELYRLEFEDLLGRHFRNYALYGQRVLFGSAVFGAEKLSKIGTFMQEEQAIRSAEGLIDPLYWIGLASDANLPAFESGLLEQPIADSHFVQELLAERASAVAARDAQIGTLNGALAVRENDLATLNGAVAERDARIAAAHGENARLAAAVAEARSENAKLGLAIAEARSGNAKFGLAIAEARSGNAKLGMAVAEARSENAKLDAALSATRNENAGLSETLAEARRQSAERQAMLDGQAAELAAVRQRATQAAAAAADLQRELRAALDGQAAELAAVRQQAAQAAAAAADLQRELRAALDGQAAELAAVRQRATQATAASADLQRELRTLQHSASWRITKPLRWVRSGMDRFARRAARLLDRACRAIAFRLDSASWRITKPLRWVRSGMDRFARRAAPLPDRPRRTITSRLGGRRFYDYCVSLANSKLIAASGLFDRNWYLEQNPDIRAAGVNPLLHYLRYGATEGRDPNPLFDSDWYLEQNPDVRAAGINPLVHYVRHGANEGRAPSPRFDGGWYLDHNPDVRAAGMNPLAHYLGRGASEGRDPKGAGGTARSVRPQEKRQDVGRSTSAADDWADYTTLRHQISVARESARRDFHPRAHALIRLNDDDPINFAKRIVLPRLKQDPLVSVVIPVYNAIGYVLECLASVSMHSGAVAFEVIVIDDASSEETGRVLRSVDNIVYLRNETNIGFGNSCNRARTRARGRYIVFLNSDTQVCEGWLEEFLRTFAAEAKVGAVGPKLVFPDGRLQEAGALINRDGTATLIGVFDNPDLPRYDRRREVPYCSGACLMLEVETFDMLGGFDEIFAPAYSEDADFCFRLRQAGLRVIYSPQSVVIHHLSASTNQVSADYKKNLSIRNQQRFCERWQQQIDELNRVRVIAFYLPQYHPIRENDMNWGKGFTDWKNVVKATPNFAGHCQPRLPRDLGFYDLRVADVMEEQAKLAKQYGIYGFCFYYYWFDGRRVLEMPLERLLETNKPDIPFCVAWANENWTRRWDGGDQGVILAQNHSDRDDRAVINDIIRYLRHPNYIRVGNRPLVAIYRPALFPDIKRTTEIWRNSCRAAGLGEIFLAMVGAMEYAESQQDPAEFGFDAVIEFPPHNMGVQIDPPGPLINQRFRGHVHDYRTTVAKFAAKQLPGHLMFRGVMPGWDNTPRNQDRSASFAYASPGSYQAWLEFAMQDARETSFGDEQIVFVNAWNEWAEGAFLEPDVRFGYQYLEATRNAHDAWLMEPPNRK